MGLLTDLEFRHAEKLARLSFGYLSGQLSLGAELTIEKCNERHFRELQARRSP